LRRSREDYNAVRLPQGDFNLSLFSGRIDWNASVRLLSSLIVQSDNVDHLTNIQAVVMTDRSALASSGPAPA
jgi:hypothetical protein